MDQYLADKYNDLQLDNNLLELICHLVNEEGEEGRIAVLQIFLNQQFENMKNEANEGVTKAVLMNEIIMDTKKLDKKKNEFKKSKDNLSKHKCNDIINFLTGATLIYYVDIKNSREKPYFLTKRGMQVCVNLLKKGILKKV
ncbi:hypothetical protein [Wukongibacter baidiensis]